VASPEIEDYMRALETGTRRDPRHGILSVVDQTYVVGTPVSAGVSRTFAAFDLMREADCALEVYPQDAGESVGAIRPLMARLSALGDPRLLEPLHAGFLQSGEVFVVRRSTGWVSVEDVLRGPVPVELALHVSAELAALFELAHAAGVVHGTLHPADVWLVRSRSDGTLVGVAVSGFERSVLLRPNGNVSASRRRDPYSHPRLEGVDADSYAVAAIARALMVGTHDLTCLPQQVAALVTRGAPLGGTPLRATLEALRSLAPPASPRDASDPVRRPAAVVDELVAGPDGWRMAAVVLVANLLVCAIAGALTLWVVELLR
jgi:hypothetical protein